jgi:hypothetical protein
MESAVQENTQAEAAQGAVDLSVEEAGRAAVRALLIGRLRDAGLNRDRGITEEKQVRMQEALIDHLAYMRADLLAVLAENALHHAVQVSKGVWPSEYMVRQWAEALQPKPFSQHPIVASWLRSVEGPIALGGGYLVPLLRWLLRYKRPILDAELKAVRAEGQDLQGKLARIRERLDQGRPWPDDHEVLATYLRHEAMALQYVDAGNAGRAAKAAAPASVPVPAGEVAA